MGCVAIVAIVGMVLVTMRTVRGGTVLIKSARPTDEQETLDVTVWVNLCAMRQGKPRRYQARRKSSRRNFGIVRATVPFHGEHDAQEPTKVKCGQGGGRASALAPEL